MPASNATLRARSSIAGISNTVIKIGTRLHQYPNLLQPVRPLRSRAARHGRRGAPHHTAHTAQPKNAALPQRIKRVTKQRGFALGRGVGGVEHQRVAGPQQPTGTPSGPTPDG